MPKIWRIKVPELSARQINEKMSMTTIEIRMDETNKLRRFIKRGRKNHKNPNDNANTNKLKLWLQITDLAGIDSIGL